MTHSLQNEGTGPSGGWMHRPLVRGCYAVRGRTSQSALFREPRVASGNTEPRGCTYSGHCLGCGRALRRGTGWWCCDGCDFDVCDACGGVEEGEEGDE